jgi:tartrate-resistant acid phosphatase type 5
MKWRLRFFIRCIGVILLTIAAPGCHKKPPSLHLGAPATLRFFILGDTGSGDENQKKVAQGMDTLCGQNMFSGIILLGDQFYPRGVSSPQDPLWQSHVEIPYGLPCLKKLPIFPILGNHDARANPEAQVDYSKTHPRWVMPQRFYSVDFGDLLHITALDSSQLSWDGILFFWDEMFQKKTKPWHIVLSHHPLDSASSKGFAYQGGLLGFFLRPLAQGRFDGWFSGHSHHLEHRVTAQGDHLFILGGGGGPLYPVPDPPPKESLFLASSFGFGVLEATTDRLRVSIHNQDGGQLYSSGALPTASSSR